MGDGAKVLLLIAAIVAAGWYFVVYDTAAGRCNRGDLNACIVYGLQHAPAPIPIAPPRSEAPLPTAAVGPSDCVIGHGVNNVRLVVASGAQECAARAARLNERMTEKGWSQSDDVPSVDTLVCVGGWRQLAFEVWDSGGRFYGGLLCTELRDGAW